MLEEKILTSLNEIENYGDELAYFGLTTKLELPFRDWLAFNLMKKSNGEYVIGREYPKRTDLSLIVNNNVISCLELKACYTFDLYKNYQKEWTRILEDYSKYNNRDEKVFFMLIAVHPLTGINKNTKEKFGLIKYIDDHIKLKISSEEVLKKISIDVLTNCHNPNLKLRSHGFKNLGQAFDIKVGLAYFIWEKI